MFIMFIETVRIQSLSNNSYVVGSEQSGQCAVIDPAGDNARSSTRRGTSINTRTSPLIMASASSTPWKPTFTTILSPAPGN